MKTKNRYKKTLAALGITGYITLIPLDMSMMQPKIYRPAAVEHLNLPGEAELPKYADVTRDVELWKSMSARDWDDVEPKVRKEAYQNMILYWMDFYEVGSKDNIPKKEIEKWLFAMADLESEYNHRAVSRTGDRGVMQPSIGLMDVTMGFLPSYDKLKKDKQVYEIWDDPFLNIKLGVLEFMNGLDTYHNIEDAVKHYGKGPRGIWNIAGSVYFGHVKKRKDAAEKTSRAVSPDGTTNWQ